MLGLSGQVSNPCVLLVLSGVFFTTGVSEAGQGSQGCKGEDLRTGEVVWTAWLTFEQAWAHSCPSFPSQPAQVVFPWVLLVLTEASFTPGVTEAGQGTQSLQGGGIEDRRSGMDSLAHV